ncbi:MAG: response regulator [bacterium]|nr:response regulator [bacterium]
MREKGMGQRMYKLLIVDDESLARIGLQTMVANLYRENVEIVGTAQNGQEALDLMGQNVPDVIISDIKMPVMTGLELAKYIEENYQKKPIFIFLTSYEDFHYAREALQRRAFDYLVKMELNRDVLKKVLDRAFAEIDRRREAEQPIGKENGQGIQEMPNVFVSRFYYSLLNGRYVSEEQVLEAAQGCGQDVQAECYVTMAMRICYPNQQKAEMGYLYNLYFSILNSVKMALTMHFSCYVTAYSHEVMGCILMLSEAESRQELWEAAAREAEILCRQYFNIRLCTGIGKRVTSLPEIAKSFQTAQLAQTEAEKKGMDVVTYSGNVDAVSGAMRDTDGGDLDKRMVEALEHCDSEEFAKIVRQIEDSVRGKTMEAAISQISMVVHLLINCLENGETVLSQAFSAYPSGYQSLYSARTLQELEQYLEQIRICVSERMDTRRNDPKYKLVQDAKQYIKEHIYERLTLAEVAGAIGISQNYLSSLFRLYNGSGFSEYVAESKIQLAKEMLKKGNMKVYQVSEKLGFDNQQYFSKVYKKYTGYSPSEKASVPENEA